MVSDRNGLTARTYRGSDKLAQTHRITAISMMKPCALMVVSMAGIVLTSCRNEDEAALDATATSRSARKGVVAIDAAEVKAAAVVGQTVYVPAFSSIYTADLPHMFRLAVTLTVRNTDRQHPLIVTLVEYRDQDGQLIRDYLPRPLRVAPLASAEFFVKESDTRGGTAVSFLVEWVADRPIAPPMIESVMVGTASGQGVSFVGSARVIANRERSAADTSKDATTKP